MRPAWVSLLLFTSLFLEPSIPITRSLEFQLIANGLILGYMLRIRKRDISGRSVVISAPFVLFAAFVVLVPMLVHTSSNRIIFGFYEALMLLRVPVIVFMVQQSCRQWLKPIHVATLAVSLLLILTFVGLIESLHIPVFRMWFNDYYLAYQSVDTDRFANYFRIRGTSQPIIFGTTLVLLLIYAWPAVICQAGRRVQTVAWFATPLTSAVVVGTGSRLALVAMAFGLIVILARIERIKIPEKRNLAAGLAAVMILVCMYVLDTDVRTIVNHAGNRTIRLTPTDKSLNRRIEEYTSGSVVTVIGKWGDETAGGNIASEVMRTRERFGLVGLTLYALTFAAIIYGLVRDRRYALSGRATVAVLSVMLLGTRVITSEEIMPVVALMMALSFFSAREQIASPGRATI